MHKITISINKGKPIKLKISHLTLQSLAALLKKKASGIEYVIDFKSPGNPEELRQRAKEYKLIYDLLIKVTDENANLDLS